MERNKITRFMFFDSKSGKPITGFSGDQYNEFIGTL